MRGASVSATAAATATVWMIDHRCSLAVQRWRRSTLPAQRYDGLHVRIGRRGNTAVVVLHGLLATGDVVGEPYDTLAANHRVIVPDLLGFGRSLDEDCDDFGPD